MTQHTEVSKLDDNVPDYIRQMDGRASLDDNFDSDDLLLPAIRLLQGTSDTCKHFAGARPGRFWHTGLDCPIEPLRFVICARHKHVLLLAPVDDGRGVLARAADAKTWDRTGSWDVTVDRKTKRTVNWSITHMDVARSGLLNWGTADPDFEQSPPAATMLYDYAVIFPEQQELGMAVISLARSAIKRAKRGLNDKIALHAANGRPLQSLVFEAHAVEESNESGDFYNWRFVSAGFADKDVYDKAMGHAEQMTKFRTSVDVPEDETPKMAVAPLPDETPKAEVPEEDLPAFEHPY